jgi:two-component system, cell cycle sensor histidine kinase and response regulator CckA
MSTAAWSHTMQPLAPSEVERLFQSGETVDLILTDVVMPGMSPLEIARRWASGEGSPKILYMSGYTDEVILRTGLLAAGGDYLPKPLTASRLAKVREVLARPRGNP